ncbi:MAG: ribosome biogenesis GTPase Der [Bacteroidales bacterium]|nr:ribosome biogenesis GTPase Der [Bacteroidales bacterium]
MSGIVAIVGRPNVGKSTLFNRLTESKTAIVDATSGVTRDRQYGQSIWNGKIFNVIDTGGLTIKSDDVFEDEIKKQVLLAIEEADIIIFLVDVLSGITDFDEAIANMLRKVKKPIIVVANKVDDPIKQYDATEFYSLGLGDYFCISSINGSGTGELLDDIVEKLPDTQEDTRPDIPHVAIIGRPNVGKSSLLNALIGEERHIVTPLAGTTRDAIGTRYTKFGYDFYFVDTAGLRKKEKVTDNLEFYSVLRSIRAVEQADVCILLLDAREGIESQDMNILHLAIKNNKGIVICVNKWDLIEDKHTNSARDFETKLREKMAPFNDVPIIFTSVIEKQRIQKVMEKTQDVYNNRSRKIPTSKLNEVMLEAVERYHPPAVKGKLIKIKYVTQLPTPFPSFAFFCSNSKYVKDSYKRYLENKIRETYDFEGVPIRIFMREK